MENRFGVFDAVPRVLLLGGAAAIAVLLVVIVLVMLFMLLRRRRHPLEAGPPDLRIDVAALPSVGPPAEGPRLEFYGTPVRLAVLVLAPAGRSGAIPTGTALEQAVDALVPGLTAVVKAHRPLFRRWPVQLSTQGFTTTFLNQVALPGERGKGTPWCSAAGRFEAGEQQLLAGVVCVADKPNSLSQVAVQHAGQWLEVLRVKDA